MTDNDPSAKSDGFENVSREEFIRRLIRATERTAFKGGRAFKFGMEPITDKQLKLVLADDRGKVVRSSKGRSLPKSTVREPA